MAVFTKEFHFDVNSDPNLGAQNVNETGSQFEINTEQSIFLDKGGFEATISVQEATVWNTVKNVSEAEQNNHIFIDSDVQPPLFPNLIDVEIPDGNYSTSSLSAAIEREYVKAGGISGLVVLEEDFSTQKVLLKVDGTLAGPGGAQVDFTPSNTFRDLIGFDDTKEPTPPAIALVNDLAPNTAAFNVLEYFLVHWDGGQGFPTNRKFQQTIARINITARPGSQIVSTPFNPAKSEANGWIGERRNHMTFWLTDQSGTKLVETGETWSLRCVLTWKIFIEPPKDLGTENLRVQLPQTMKLLRDVLGRRRKRNLDEIF